MSICGIILTMFFPSSFLQSVQIFLQYTHTIFICSMKWAKRTAELGWLKEQNALLLDD